MTTASVLPPRIPLSPVFFLPPNPGLAVPGLAVAFAKLRSAFSATSLVARLLFGFLNAEMASCSLLSISAFFLALASPERLRGAGTFAAGILDISGVGVWLFSRLMCVSKASESVAERLRVGMPWEPELR
ncbi:hypothetical protein KC357_g76 [Hortaea werneckii]|nr:hypothetical protein KC357_g76 [Hortaea werneckii]